MPAVTGHAKLVVGVLSLALGYTLVAKLGLALDAVSGFATLVWPPTGMAYAALLLYGARLWPGVALGAFAVNLWTGAPPLAALGIACGNTLEALIASELLRRSGVHPTLARVRDVGLYVGLAALLSTGISAGTGVLSLWLSGVVPAAELPATLRAWWLGDALGALLVGPLLLTWLVPSRGGRPRRSAFEYLALVSTMLGLSFVVFGESEQSGPLEQPYCLVAVTTWAALRFGPRETTASTLALASIAVSATSFGRGPFVEPELATSLSFLQVFMASVAVTGLFLGAAVSEREARAEELTRVNAELERALSLRDAFLSVASHELKTPLSALRLQLDILLRSSRSDLDWTRERIQRVSRQVDRLQRLVLQLLEVSRIHAGRLELEPEEVELNALLAEVAGRFEEEAARAGCALELSLSGRINGSWDALRLDQVISNLLANAIKYGAGKPVHVESWLEPSGAYVRVRDEGIGIAPADHARVFERFERAASTRMEGFGLGLWISKQNAEAMGARIELTSERGEGASFVLVLPHVS